MFIANLAIDNDFFPQSHARKRSQACQRLKMRNLPQATQFKRQSFLVNIAD